MGKTPTSLFAWAMIRDTRIKEGRIPRLWVVTNKSATTQWKTEIERFLRGVKVFKSVSGDTKEERLEVFGDWLKDTAGSVFISNWAQFRDDWGGISEKYGDSWLKETQITLDEAHKIRNPDSKLGEVARLLIEKADRVHFLTASAVHNQAHDAYWLASAIDPDIMPPAVFDKLYCVKEFVKIPWGRNKTKTVPKIVGYQNLTDFKEKMAYIYLGRSDEEVEGQRPSVSYMMRTVDMSKEQRKVYDRAEMGYYLQDSGESNVSAPAMIQAQQAANAPINLDPEVKANAKADLLKEIIEDSIGDEPIILYSPYRTTIEAFMEIFKDRNPVKITGTDSEEDRFKAQEAFQKGETNMIYLTDAGGESINLQRGKHIVMISRPWAPGTYRQIVGRARRLGSKHTSILIWHLTCSDTIDEYVDSLLAKKFGPVEDIIQGRGALLPDDQVLPLEIADYARQKRKQKGRISL
jgi:SNF2 family DNA or RNA helicase